MMLEAGDMAQTYTKGFSMMAGMGFAAGSGLGREGQGRQTPVQAVDPNLAQATAIRHLGIGFAGAAGLNPADFGGSGQS